MMNQREQDLLNTMREASEEIPVPESLEPKAVEEMLKSRPKKFRWKRGYTAGVAAACALLICGAVYGNGRTGLPVPPAGEAASSSAYDGGEEDASEGSAASDGLMTAKSYEELYEYMEDYLNPGDDYAVYDTGVIREYAEKESADIAYETAAVEDSAAVAGAGSMEGAGGDYSETNVRQEGVDEADVAKTDGRYLYTLSHNERSVSVVDTKGGKLQEVAVIKPKELEQIYEFYVTDGKLILVGETYNEKVDRDDWYITRSNTTAITYDMSDPGHPKQEGAVSQSGYYTSSRVSDGYLYLFSEYYVDGDITVRDYDAYIPMVNEELIAESDIYLPTTKSANVYEVIGAVDLDRPDEVTDSKAIFTGGGALYVSGSNIYWYDTRWSRSSETVIRRISYKHGRLKAEAVGQVDGYIRDSFCIDEYQGYLRVITTDDDTNGVYVMDQEMNIVGEITGLAEDERVYSARMMGETGYFVTYKETDPLFSVDFSDPEHPEIIGELKIPGFSEYLHPYGTGKLLGIGMDVEEDGFTTNGVKLSMFDISDRTDVKEIQKYVMTNVYGAGVMYDYKAALIDVKKNLIAFSADGGDGERYYVFSYDETNGFDCLMEEDVNGNGYHAARGIYIDDTLYVVKGNIIEAYDLESFAKTDDIIL